MDENICAYWMSLIDGMGPVTGARLVEYTGSFSGVWRLTKKELANPVLGISERLSANITKSKNEDEIRSSYERLKCMDIEFYGLGHPMYPVKLKYIPSPPLGIYVRGSLPDAVKPSVAIVGARNCSEYGSLCARRISEKLTLAGLPIISGMARGIDSIAQSAALDRGGYSLGVLGCGVDVCYPHDSKGIYDQLSESGGIISEYPPGTQPKPHHFPARNRIISAMSDICVVIEAREKSGSLITADMALEQGKDVYALPGRITDSLSHGANRLIKQGAGIILSPDEFICELLQDNQAMLSDPERAGARQMNLIESIHLSPAEQLVLHATGLDPKTAGVIQEETGLDTGELMKSLMKLSVRGLIIQNQGYYTRNSENI